MAEQLSQGQFVRLVNKFKETRRDEYFVKISNALDTEMKKLINRYYISGSEKSDLEQEAKIGLLKAINDYKDVNNNTFKNFAILCCRRHIFTAIGTARRKKFSSLNNAVRLDDPILSNDGNNQSLSELDILEDHTNLSSIEHILISEEFEYLTELLLNELTDLEKQIFLAYIDDTSYKNIAKTLKLTAKCVDNGLMRIRKKASKIYDDAHNL